MDTQTDAREWVVASGGNLPHKVLAEVDPATGEKFYVGKSFICFHLHVLSLVGQLIP